MMKREDARIYVFGYNKTEYELPDNELYTPIQCGSLEPGKERWLAIGDGDSLDNISDMNHFYAETSGTYWVWKNYPKDLRYIGQCQYRRWLWFDENFDFDEIFSNADAIMPRPYKMGCDIRSHYRACHNIKDLEAMESVVKECYPEYFNGFEAIVNGNVLYYSAGFVMRTEDFERYCSFLFGALSEFRNRLGFVDMDAVDAHVRQAFENGDYIDPENKEISYQKLIGGFMAERLLSTFVITEFKRQMLFPYKLF